MDRLRKFAPFLYPYRIAFIWSFLAATIASILDGFSFALLIPFFRVLFGSSPVATEDPTWLETAISKTVGVFVTGADPQAVLVSVVVLIFAATLVKNLFGYLGAWQSARIQEGIARDLRVALFSHVLTMRPRYLEDQKVGQLISRVLADAATAKQFVTQALTSVLRDGVLVLVYLAVLFSLSWRLTLVTLVLAPTLAAVLGPITKRIRANLRRALDDRGELSALTSEVATGARVVKAFGGEEYENKRFRAAAQRFYTGIVKTQGFSIMASPLSETLGAGIIVLLLAAAGWFATMGAPVRPELFMTFLAVTLRLLGPVKSLSQVPVRAESSLGGAERIFEVLEHQSDDLDEPGTDSFAGLTDSIELKTVSFEYRPGEPALENVSIKFPRSTVTGIVGPSGAGKSTLADMLTRFIEPSSGKILVDGKDLSTFSTSTWRKRIGLVSQETIIFNDTVLTNIAYGEEAPDLERAMQAARAANAHRFIEELPGSYDNMLGERGTRLSGGERQRIALARVLYRDPPLLILDEATSSLDTESERLIQEALEGLFEDRTVVVIAHRLSTIVRADRIVVLEKGQVVEQGTHTELVSAGGLYQQLYSTGEDTGVI